MNMQASTMKRLLLMGSLVLAEYTTAGRDNLVQAKLSSASVAETVCITHEVSGQPRH